jgi:hypothetical protein
MTSINYFLINVVLLISCECTQSWKPFSFVMGLCSSQKLFVAKKKKHLYIIKFIFSKYLGYIYTRASLKKLKIKIK